MKSQNEKILKHLKSGKKLTAMEALNKFKCFRLAARIRDLKDQGHNILSVMVKRNGSYVAQYSLGGK